MYLKCFELDLINISSTSFIIFKSLNMPPSSLVEDIFFILYELMIHINSQ